MSSAANTFGTQSPPLEASGDSSPMGVSNIQGDKPKSIPDSQQREQYFQAPSSDLDQQQNKSQNNKEPKLKQD